MVRFDVGGGRPTYRCLVSPQYFPICPVFLTIESVFHVRCLALDINGNTVFRLDLFGRLLLP